MTRDLNRELSSIDGISPTPSHAYPVLVGSNLPLLKIHTLAQMEHYLQLAMSALRECGDSMTADLSR